MLKMYGWQLILLIITFWANFVRAAVIPGNDDVDEQGLYSKSDHVTILTSKNFDRKIYGQQNAFLLQFYNSYCGHCRAFAPKFKSLAAELEPWKNIVKLAVIDCSIEENNEICRQFEVMAYPSLRYLHENYVKSNANVGDKFRSTDSAEKLKIQLINKMQNEQTMGRLSFAPPLNIVSYVKLTDTLSKIPKDVIYTFLIFENDNSTIGSELSLDMNDYEHIKVKRVYETSELADVIGVKSFPGLVAVGANMEATLLSPKTSTKQDFLKAINTFLRLKNYKFPLRDIDRAESRNSIEHSGMHLQDTNIVYYSDLEKTLKTSLHTEITRHKALSNESLQALIEYLNVLIIAYPFRGNLKEYIVDLRDNLNSKSQWSGSEVYDLVIALEATHAPVFAPDLDYVRCKGSRPGYRGYSCGLWTLFHTLTVNAAQKPGNDGPRVLRAMHGYVKHFFGCTECSEHFQAMAARNRIFDVKDNDKAVLWLWISHNEVNLRLAGDVTEDPEHPKLQFPSVTQCRECRQDRGAWNLPAVYDYLQRIYGANNIQDVRRGRSASSLSSPLSNLDIGMLSFLLIHRLWRDNLLLI
ncbi:sulfhydryl oxidase 1 isoform X2 [Maniola jurtina]|uniref:sulfhydryl oxidase 1 isoform X2 n=1 Tax=Maniola jurtina TaxID=191418 RepID=UPI001E68A267|nr:sulfhydryl oxidase 1 isoform X2 [Maniola jurtina]